MTGIAADSSLFNNGFDIGPMTLDSMDDSGLSQAFSLTSAPTPQSASLAGDGGFGLLGDDASAPGAGPAPMGALSGQTGTSTLTEFTKRRNWPAKVVEELKDLLQILDADGRIKYVSPSVTTLTGYQPDEILDRFLREFIHPDDVGVFTAELNESIATGNTLRIIYRMKKKDGTDAKFEVVGHAHIASAKFAANPNNKSPFCQAVFMMARQYPTKNAGLLDSFLEHKIENERLKRRIAELRREEQDDFEDAHRNWPQSREGESEITPSEGTMATNSNATPYYNNPDSHGHGSERGSLNIALTGENLEKIAGGRPDSLREKMARYEGNSSADTIEMLTGLRYQEGERSLGITTGNASPTLIKGDAGIAIPMDRDPRTGEKKKKLKVAEEYVCTDCGEFNRLPLWAVVSQKLMLMLLQGHLIRRSGGRDRAAPRLYATHAVYAGQKRRKRQRKTPAATGSCPPWTRRRLRCMENLPPTCYDRSRNALRNRSKYRAMREWEDGFLPVKSICNADTRNWSYMAFTGPAMHCHRAGVLTFISCAGSLLVTRRGLGDTRVSGSLA
jgi:PAS domain S-box-containing protein